jgi:hypothetical protein
VVRALGFREDALVLKLSMVLVQICGYKTAISRPLFLAGIKYRTIAEELLYLVGGPLFVVHCQFILLIDLKELLREDGLVKFNGVLDLIITSHLLFQKWFYVVSIVILRQLRVDFDLLLLRLFFLRQIELREDIYEFITDLDLKP